jgi:DNA repair protein RadC
LFGQKEAKTVQQERGEIPMRLKLKEKTSIKSAENVFKIMLEIFQREDEIEQSKEHLWVMGVNVRNVVQYIDLAYIGTKDHCSVNVSEIFRIACIKGVHSILVIHNHPSGDVSPSLEDKRITEKLKQAGDILQIKFLDHVIISREGYYSFSDEGLLY